MRVREHLFNLEVSIAQRIARAYELSEHFEASERSSHHRVVLATMSRQSFSRSSAAFQQLNSAGFFEGYPLRDQAPQRLKKLIPRRAGPSQNSDQEQLPRSIQWNGGGIIVPVDHRPIARRCRLAALRETVWLPPPQAARHISAPSSKTLQAWCADRRLRCPVHRERGSYRWPVIVRDPAFRRPCNRRLSASADIAFRVSQYRRRSRQHCHCAGRLPGASSTADRRSFWLSAPISALKADPLIR